MIIGRLNNVSNFDPKNYSVVLNDEPRRSSPSIAPKYWYPLIYLSFLSLLISMYTLFNYLLNTKFNKILEYIKYLIYILFSFIFVIILNL